MIQHASTLQDTIPTREDSCFSESGVKFTVSRIHFDDRTKYPTKLHFSSQRRKQIIRSNMQKKTTLQKALEIHSDFFTLYAWTTNNVLCRTTYVPLATVKLGLIRSGERTCYPNKSQLIIISHCYILFFLFFMHFSF